MVKAYLRYEPLATFGVIASTQSNIVCDHTGKIAVTPALEEVILWDLKKGSEVLKTDTIFVHFIHYFFLYIGW